MSTYCILINKNQTANDSERSHLPGKDGDASLKISILFFHQT